MLNGERWRGGEGLEVDVGCPTRLRRQREASVRIARYRIQVSDANANTWHDVISGEANGREGWVNRIAAVEAHKLRLPVESTKGNDPANDTPSIWELRVYHTEQE
jgi:hypothetical protein